VCLVIEELIECKYLCNTRFTESFIRSRQNKGFGPIKIRKELKNKGIDNNTIDDYLKVNSSKWYDIAMTQYKKKYRDIPVSDYKEWSKRARFLQGRGFAMEHIHVTVPSANYD
jgi:regulatory protein